MITDLSLQEIRPAFRAGARGTVMRLPGVDRDQIRGYFEKSGQVARFHELEESL